MASSGRIQPSCVVEAQILAVDLQNLVLQTSCRFEVHCMAGQEPRPWIGG